MNRKIMASLVVVLLCIGIISAGYATWLTTVVHSNTQTYGVASFSVSEKKITVSSAVFKFSNNVAATIGYDGKTYDSDWMKVTNAGNTAVPSVSFTLEATISNWSSSFSGDASHKIKVWFSDFKTTESGTDASEVDGNRKLLKSPVLTDRAWIEIDGNGNCAIRSYELDGEGRVTGNIVTLTTPPTEWATPVFDKSTGKLTMTFTAPWGDAFGGVNPHQYINSKEIYSNSDRDADTTKLTNLAKIQYLSITIKAQAIPASGS